jgi:hypothetical protein
VFRRFVCFMLILLLLANQAIAMACVHEHAEATPDGHQHRSHIHLGVHDHHHHDGGHQHDIGPAVDAGEVESGRRRSACEPMQDVATVDVELPCNHDCDAIFVVDQAFQNLPPVEQNRGSDCVGLTVFKLLDWPLLTFSVHPIRPIAHKGPFSQGRCALFLQILSLRI